MSVILIFEYHSERLATRSRTPFSFVYCKVSIVSLSSKEDLEYLARQRGNNDPVFPIQYKISFLNPLHRWGCFKLGRHRLQPPSQCQATRPIDSPRISQIRSTRNVLCPFPVRRIGTVDVVYWHAERLVVPNISRLARGWADLVCVDPVGQWLYCGHVKTWSLLNVGIESGQLITKSKDKGDCGRKNTEGTLEGCVLCHF